MQFAIWSTIIALPALLQELMLLSWVQLPILAIPLASKPALIKPLPIRPQERAILAISHAWPASIVLIIAPVARVDIFGLAGPVTALAPPDTSLTLMALTAPNAFPTVRPATVPLISARFAQYQGSIKPFSTMFQPPIQPALDSALLDSTDKLTTEQVQIFALLATLTALYALVIQHRAPNASQPFTSSIVRV